jgi:hypothetical protein
MAGSPIKRARREAAAKAALEAQKALDMQKDQPMDEDRPYTAELTAQIVELLIDGVALTDTKCGDELIEPGIESRLNVSRSTITRWQTEYPDFAEAIRNAREESAHRIADQIKALAAVAMKDPARANSARVAGDLLKWSAMVRNRAYYGDKSEVTVNKSVSLIDALKQIQEREEAEKPQAASEPGKAAPETAPQRQVH